MTRFLEQLSSAWPLEKWQRERTVLAVSGGADSVALLRGIQELAGNDLSRIFVAHFNHQLRGDASDNDEHFLRELCNRLQITCIIGKATANQLRKSGQDGLEAAARQTRYKFLSETAEQVGARYLLTAHTVDDQVETVLHHILRGTGLVGLAGIPRVRPLSNWTTLVRPMLGIRRSEVLDFLQKWKQDYCEDLTNQELEYTRNRLRLQLLPLLEQQYNPQVWDALIRLSRQAAEAIVDFDQRTEHWFDEHCRRTNTNANQTSSAQIDVLPLSKQPLLLVRHFLARLWQQQNWPRQGMSAEHWESVAQMICNRQATALQSYNLPGGGWATLDSALTSLTIAFPRQDAADTDEESMSIH